MTPMMNSVRKYFEILEFSNMIVLDIFNTIISSLDNSKTYQYSINYNLDMQIILSVNLVEGYTNILVDNDCDISFMYFDNKRSTIESYRKMFYFTDNYEIGTIIQHLINPTANPSNIENSISNYRNYLVVAGIGYRTPSGAERIQVRVLSMRPGLNMGIYQLVDYSVRSGEAAGSSPVSHTILKTYLTVMKLGILILNKFKSYTEGVNNYPWCYQIKYFLIVLNMGQ